MARGRVDFKLFKKFFKWKKEYSITDSVSVGKKGVCYAGRISKQDVLDYNAGKRPKKWKNRDDPSKTKRLRRMQKMTKDSVIIEVNNKLIKKVLKKKKKGHKSNKKKKG